jgi:predicted small lipoprotein YifL
LICYDGVDEGVGVTVHSSRTYVRIAAIGALVAALGLAGCGRKSGLDLPPSAAVAGPADPASPAAKQNSGVGPDGKAVAPQSGPKKPIFLDWLVD